MNSELVASLKKNIIYIRLTNQNGSNRLTNKFPKFIPFRGTKKKFSVQLELFPEMQWRKNSHKKLQKQILLKRFHKSLKGFDKPTDKRTFEQNKKIDFKI